MLASTRITAIPQNAAALAALDAAQRVDAAGQSAGAAVGSAASAAGAAASGAVSGAVGRVGVPPVDMSGVNRSTAGLGAQIGGALGGLSGRIPGVR